MNLFRSEEHIGLWLGGQRGGATIPVSMLSLLAHEWWSDRLAPDWAPHTLPQNQAILDRLGLIGAFWSLTPVTTPD